MIDGEPAARRVTLTGEHYDEWLAALATVPGVRWCGVIKPSDWYQGALDEVLA